MNKRKSHSPENEYSQPTRPEEEAEAQQQSQVEIELPNYSTSGILSKDSLTKHGIILKYSPPIESRIPSIKYRLYVFKQETQLDILHIHRQAYYLVGREKSVCDVITLHPSCSKQHAVIQFRHVSSSNIIKPYIIDLNSSNGTFVNGVKIPTQRYYELKLGDCIIFGTSTREYVLMNDDDSKS